MRCFVLSLLTMGACSVAFAAEVDDWKEKLVASQKAWDAAKEKSGGNYSYDVTTVFYSGTSHTTTVVVKNNAVVERRFEKGSGINPAKPNAKPAKSVVEWVETAADLGKHEGPAAKPKTVDELYSDAFKVLNGPIAKYEQLTVAFDKQGLLKDCFTVDKRLADDNTRKGVAIESLKLGEK